MIVAVEDALLEAVALRLLAEYAPDCAVSAVMGMKGNTHLKATCRELNRAAAGIDILLLTDLDDPQTCAPSLIADWLGHPPAPRMIFRVAVVEAETWLLADKPQIATFLGVSQGHIASGNPELIDKPKEHLISAARRSSRRFIREGIPPQHGSTCSIGPQYNPLLTQYAANEWRPEFARKQSDSLERAVRRITQLATT